MGPLNKTHPCFFLCLQGRFKAEILNQRLRHQMANYVVPGVSEYLQARVECKRLQQDIHTWERKVRIAQVYFTSSDPVGDGRPHCSMFPHFRRKCCAQTLLRLAQMTAKASAKAATPACRDVGGPRSAGHHIPVKLPPLPEHRWKGRKLQMLDVVV